jgi:RNA polymerase sigma-70 factor (ECF subfamily)
VRLGDEAHDVITASPEVGELTNMPSRSVSAGFSAVYAQHYDAVFRAALRVTGNQADAEDVLQTVFLRVLAQADHDEVARRPAAYFRRAAVNAAVDLLRRRAAHGETTYDDTAGQAVVDTPLLLKERLRRAVATLQDDDATLFLLRHVEGLSLEELATLFQLEKNNIGVRLHRIRARLQKELER